VKFSAKSRFDKGEPDTASCFRADGGRRSGMHKWVIHRDTTSHGSNCKNLWTNSCNYRYI